MRRGTLQDQADRERDDERYLALLGDRVRSARSRRGMTRKILSGQSGVSERYLAQLESGRGNVSIILLRQIAGAMNLALSELVQDGPDRPVEMALILEQLADLSGDELADLHSHLRQRYAPETGNSGRIALIGLRGAGKSTLGRALAKRLELPFVQLNKEIEEAAGMGQDEIFDLLGQAAFRRLERQCLEQVIENHARAVIETGGGLVAEAGTYERLLSSCHTIWLQASPEEHMARVAAQGDQRPMAGNREAMDDLRRILMDREGLYRKADATLDTSGRTTGACLDDLAAMAPKY
ncbi:MAG: helix-turn-helix transcriptional regulator [Rhodospirillaceae bacterium]|nr:helix-turn-helix transcriptional regulator [Rhodospirillaceae bacterium]MBT3490908.1 helix-turn-helix transcriptional regulator [Rhodospirillaceae bacterium]MBT3781983.1 helix-turn-helix transcriptional regulator [Rhodospirillaceae bacterium]MBT3978320.1 helix-turn-helix transcriptional regulator [Rhodospirillaceae bacterium]MBT4561394.1 helix-turn-helix transcriptional regulator [Rhodospirillaceae bacterium]